jgi:hypothetical protein
MRKRKKKRKRKRDYGGGAERCLLGGKPFVGELHKGCEIKSKSKSLSGSNPRSH